MTYRRYEMGDPARVLEMKGEDCANCVSLRSWWISGHVIEDCGNPKAPEKLRKSAPAKRCEHWKHKGNT